MCIIIFLELPLNLLRERKDQWFIKCIPCPDHLKDGASYGRLVGRLLSPIANLNCCLFALLRAASFLGGTMRMTVSLCIFVWLTKTGWLLDVLSGHEGPVHGLMFSPTNVSSFCFILVFNFA
ncbi:putative chloride channel, voltage gated, chloride channel, core [Helianthus annuus]|nr:putative chloride channel, voltage gated, chloride channel, core [Helianthus annuus]